MVDLNLDISVLRPWEGRLAGITFTPPTHLRFRTEPDGNWAQCCYHTRTRSVGSQMV